MLRRYSPYRFSKGGKGLFLCDIEHSEFEVFYNYWNWDGKELYWFFIIPKKRVPSRHVQPLALLEYNHLKEFKLTDAREWYNVSEDELNCYVSLIKDKIIWNGL